MAGQQNFPQKFARDKLKRASGKTASHLLLHSVALVRGLAPRNGHALAMLSTAPLALLS